MEPEERKLSVKSKIWIVDANGDIVFGAGRLRIFDAIERHGSIHAAAKELNMSYRAVWGKIKTSEKRFGRPLLIRQVGGSQGGGSQLTEWGKALVNHFKQLQTLSEATANALFQQLGSSGFPCVENEHSSTADSDE